MTFDVEAMLELWKTGKYTYNELARRFKKDHTTIMHHVKKAGLWVPMIPQPRILDCAGGGEKTKFNRGLFNADPLRVHDNSILNRPLKVPEIKAPPVVHKYDHLLYEDVNTKTKTYAQYLAQAKKRKGGKWYRQFAPYRGIQRSTAAGTSTRPPRSKNYTEDLDVVPDEF